MGPDFDRVPMRINYFTVSHQIPDVIPRLRRHGETVNSNVFLPKIVREAFVVTRNCTSRSPAIEGYKKLAFIPPVEANFKWHCRGATTKARIFSNR